jgi:hypothetical protein
VGVGMGLSLKTWVTQRVYVIYAGNKTRIIIVIWLYNFKKCREVTNVPRINGNYVKLQNIQNICSIA